MNANLDVKSVPWLTYFSAYFKLIYIQEHLAIKFWPLLVKLASTASCDTTVRCNESKHTVQNKWCI